MRMKTTITFELESGIREQLAAICDRYNLSLEEAFTLFAATVVQAGRFPYDMEVPNAVTQAAMAAAEKTVVRNSSFVTACEQENVKRMPPGLICEMARALSRL